MAMKDIKSFPVAPADEEKTVQLWMSFGWELKSTQEVKTQDVQEFTGQDRDGTEHYQTTKGEHYIKLTFEREKSIPHYEELVELENRYYSLPKVQNYPSIEPQKPKRFGVLWIILTIVGLCLSFVPGILIIIWRLVTYPGKLRNWRAEYALWEKRGEIKAENDKIQKEKSETLKRAQALLQ